MAEFEFSKEPIINWIQYRLRKQNKNFMCVVTGETGSGKSLVSISLADKIDPNFSVKNIIFDIDEFLDKIEHKAWEEGSAIILDEAGIQASSKEFMSLRNRAIREIAQTFRKDNLAVFFVLPSVWELDKSIRRLLHGYIETKKIDYDKEKTCVKFFRIRYNSKLDKFYYHSFKKTGEGHVPIKVKSVWISRPKKRLETKYEIKKTEELKKQYEKTRKKREGRISGIKRYTHTCINCKYEWSGNKEKPRQCPNCRTRNWFSKDDDQLSTLN